jgi:hypothetical protein
MSDDTHSTDRDVQILISIFNRKGGPGGGTRVFPDFPADIQERILSSADLEVGEVPVVCCMPSPDTWLLITSRRVIHQRSGMLWSIGHGELQDVTIDLRSAAAQGITDKAEMEDLLLTSRLGERSVKVEAGPPLSAVLHVLRRIASVNQQRSGAEKS